MAKSSVSSRTRAPKSSPALPAGRMVGYARVSTTGQTVAAQVAGLRAVGCTVIFEETGSGASRERPELAKCLASIMSGDTLVVPALDRVARGLTHLLEVVDVIKAAGGHFRSIREAAIDTSSISGMLLVQIIGAIAQFERELIRERTRLGIRAAMAAGKKMGAPALRDRKTRKAALAKMTAARDASHSAKLAAGSAAWLPTLLAMRPASPWPDVCAVLSQAGSQWSEERLRRAARRCVRQGLAPATILDRSERRAPDDRTMQLVCAIRLASPAMSVREIGAQLEAMKERTVRGGAAWSPSSVQMLLQRAVACGMLPASDDEERIAA